MNGKSETLQDTETGVLKSEPKSKKCKDLIEKQIGDRQTQNLRLWNPLVGCVRSRDLGRICRDFSFFRGSFTTPFLVRPTVNYASTVWDLYQQYQLQWLENVERRAPALQQKHMDQSKLCNKGPHHLQWPSLQHRRKGTRLTLLHKALHSKAAVNIPSMYIEHKPTLITRRSHLLKFLPLHASCHAYKYSFWPCII